MSGPDWYRWYPSKWLAGTLSLTLEQRGLYDTIINVILDRGACPDDERYLCRLCGLRAPRLQRLLSELVATGKIQRENGTLSQQRANTERVLSEQFTTIQRERANKRWAKTRENNDLADTISGTYQLQPQPHKKEDSDSSLRSESPRTSRAGRATRLPHDWHVEPDQAAYAQSLALDPNRVAADFADYWHAKAGREACKLDWPATWRRWCRKDADGRANHRNQPNGRDRGSVVEAARNVLARMEQGHQAHEGTGEAPPGNRVAGR